MALNDPLFSAVYDCNLCSKAQQRQRGCIKPKKRSTGFFDCICGGKKDKCSICKGSGSFKVYGCPRGILRSDYSISRAISSFYYWVNSNYTQYPDGLPLYYQPLKMLDTFELLSTINQQQKKKQDGRQN